jgi:type IV fimbrial biogenesis protein FimT
LQINLKALFGVTLVELILVLAVVVILTLIATPGFITLIQNYRLSTTSEALYNALQFAKSEAVKENATIYVSFQTGDTWCYGINANSACDCSTASNCGLGATSAPAAQQLSLSATGLTNNAISFEPIRGAANAAASVTYTIYGQSTLIRTSISLLGNLQICSTGISGYTAC